MRLLNNCVEKNQKIQITVVTVSHEAITLHGIPNLGATFFHYTQIYYAAHFRKTWN